jgi:hypothetical protein
MLIIIGILAICFASVVIVAIKESNKQKVDKIDESAPAPENVGVPSNLVDNTNADNSAASGSIEYSS